MELIIRTSNHACEAHFHLTTVASKHQFNWPKVTYREMLQIIMKSAVHPLVQMSIPDGFLKPIKGKKPQTSEEGMPDKIQKMILPRPKAACWKHKPKNRLTRILAAAVWLKLCKKYFNTRTTKKACKLFQVRAKQLSRVLTSCKIPWCLWKKRWRPKRARQEEKKCAINSSSEERKAKKDDDDDDDEDNRTRQCVKDRPH